MFCLLKLKRLPWPYGLSLGWGRLFLWGLLYVVSGVVRSDDEVFCDCGGFTFSVRVIQVTNVYPRDAPSLLGLSMVWRCSLKRSFIKASFSLSYAL